MKAIVAYSSRTGNTERLARTAQDVLGAGTLLTPVDSAPDPGDAELVAVGFWLKAGEPDPGAAAYLQKVGRRKLFLFATHGAAVDSDHARNALNVARSLAGSARIVGTFSCQGEVEPGFLEKAMAKTPRPPWVDAAVHAVGHPNTADLDRLREILIRLKNG